MKFSRPRSGPAATIEISQSAAQGQWSIRLAHSRASSTKLLLVNRASVINQLTVALEGNLELKDPIDPILRYRV
jgi:hypothetical protein